MAIPLQTLLGLYQLGGQMAGAAGNVARQAKASPQQRQSPTPVYYGGGGGGGVMAPPMRSYTVKGPVVNPGAYPDNESGRRANLINEIAMAEQALRIMSGKNSKGPPRPELMGNSYQEASQRLKSLQSQLKQLDAPRSNPSRQSSSFGGPVTRGGDGANGASGGTGAVPYQGYTGLEQGALNSTPPWLQNFLAEADKAQKEAKAKNEQRYQSILGGYKQRTANAEKTLGKLGATERMAIGDRYQTGRASAEQDLISRGLGNTTIRSSVMRGYDTEKDRALTRLAEDQANLRLQYIPTLEGDRLGFMERRNDVGPDLGQISQLSAALGQSGFGLPGNVQGPSAGQPGASGAVAASPFQASPLAIGGQVRNPARAGNFKPTAPTGGTPLPTPAKPKAKRKPAGNPPKSLKGMRR